MTAVALLDPPPAPSAARIALATERPQDASAVEALVAQAFGPGRFAKTAERVREHAVLRTECGACAWWEGELAGAVRLWSVAVGGAPALFLGPIAVAAHLRGRGMAAALTEHACAAARAAGETAVVLVGDLDRFGPLGFAPVPPGRIVLPGPVDARRILARSLIPGLVPGAAEVLEGPMTGRAS